MGDENPTFEEIIKNLEHDREQAVQALVERYGNHVLRVVRRHLGRRMRIRFDSEDFLQAVWATLFVKPTAFEHIQNETQLQAYLAKIAFHKVIDQRRANTLVKKRDQKREVTLPEPDLEDQRFVAELPSPSEYLIANEELEKLQRELPYNLHWMIECRLQGMTFEEIANKAGLHERTVRRLFEKLRRRMVE